MKWYLPEVFQTRTGKIIVTLAVLGILLLGLRACFNFGARQGKSTPGVPVTTAKVQQKDMPVELYAVGTVEPFNSVAVNSQVSGTLLAVHFAEGQAVKTGDLLFTIDPKPFEAVLKEHEANLEVQKARAENARLLLKRYEKLTKQDYITQAQFDQAKADALASEAGVRAAAAAVENAKLQLGYTRITASLDGRTGNLLVKAGNLLKANDAGSIMVRINQIHPVLVRFAVPEQFIQEIKQQMGGQPLEVKVNPQSKAADVSIGKLNFIDNSVDRATGTILLKGLFENDNEGLWPGEFVEVHLLLRVAKDAKVIPNAAVLTGQKGPYVYVIGADNKASLRLIKTDFSYADETVVAHGLETGETVVTDGQLNLGPGAGVSVKNAAVPAEGQNR